MQNNMQNSARFIFCILCILKYVKYAEYVKKYATICKLLSKVICQICKIICKTIVQGPNSAYSAYLNTENTIHNMLWADSACRCIFMQFFLHTEACFSAYSAYFLAYIFILCICFCIFCNCNPHFVYMCKKWGINVGVGSAKKFGQDLLKSETNSTMNYEIVPKSIDRLGLAQSVSKRRNKHQIYRK